MLKIDMAHLVELVLPVGSVGTDRRGKMRWVGTELMCSDHW